MTLYLDKSLSTARLLVTASEVLSGFTGAVLNVFNEATNVSSTISLPTDVSVYPERYNEFILPLSSFSGLSVGVYSYVISSGESEDLEAGQLKVVDDLLTAQQQVDEAYTYITPADTDDDFIVYQPQ